MNNIQFEHPYLLTILPILLLLSYLYPKKEDSLLFSTIKFALKSKKRFSLINFLKLSSLTFLLISLASPYNLKNLQTIPKNSKSIVLDIDISGSMEDSFKDVKKILLEFLKEQNDAKIGLVYFGDTASIFSPLTYDSKFIKSVISKVNVGALGDQNTALNDSLILSKKLLSNSKTKKKLLILLTDGIEKGSQNSFLDTKNTILKRDFELYEIGFGNEYDKSYLKAFSKKVYDANDTKELKTIFKKISSIYKSQQKTKQKEIKEKLYQFPLFLAFLSLLFYTYFINKRSLL